MNGSVNFAIIKYIKDVKYIYTHIIFTQLKIGNKKKRNGKYKT